MDEKKKLKRQSYFRLLAYAMPYRFKLTIGILSGMIVGFSLFGSFFWLKDFIEPFEKKAGIKQADFPDKDSFAEEPADKNKKESKELRKVVKTLDWINSTFKLNIPSVDKRGKMTWQFFIISTSGFILLWLFKSLATYINHLFTRWVGARVVADLRNKVVEKLLNQSLKFYGKIDIGRMISRCTNDTAAIESAIAHTIADATRCPMEILGCVSFILYVSIKNGNYALPVILFVGLPSAVLPIILLGRKIRHIYQKSFARIADVVSRMHEVFTGILIVKAYHMEEKENRVFREVNRSYFKTVVKALRKELLMQPLMEFVAVTCSIAFLIYCYSKGVLLSEISVLIVPAFMAYTPIKNLAKINTYIQRSMAAADRYFDLIDTDTSIKEKANPAEISEFRKEILLENVVFSYNEGETRVLDGINLVIPKGSVVAVVGQTGSGKTTIANLIARFYDVDSGSITVDGIDVRDMKISSLRSLIGIVSQDTILFNDTIANNIAYGCQDVSKEKIIEAAKQANAHQFIINGQHPEGYDTVVGEKGFKLSGGEKQRISIARAILKNPPILILDEATSALDTLTERLVQEALDILMENRTVFAIAHRLSTIKHADCIIVVDRGKIIESGTHDELILKNGQYKKLHDMQFGMLYGGDVRSDVIYENT